mmetsp:Transcript_71330/g.201069  ORF Transcript_71330/g.201069 Transcript_71330/m.201069 type:complete len:274 (-) Transcript_71330:3353-4174(-)
MRRFITSSSARTFRASLATPAHARLGSAAAPSTATTTRAFSGAAPEPPLESVLIANRGEIACRVITTARKMGMRTIAVYSQPEALARHVQLADEAICVGGPNSSESYLDMDNVCAAIEATGAKSVHPGYGFLSENSVFAERVEAMGVAFVGPPSGAIDSMGDKIKSKQIAIDAGVNCIPGFQGVIQDEDDACKVAREVRSWKGGGWWLVAVKSTERTTDATPEHPTSHSHSHLHSHSHSHSHSSYAESLHPAPRTPHPAPRATHPTGRWATLL